MAEYSRLAGESFDFDFEDIQNRLKFFNSKLKEYQRTTSRGKSVIYKDLEKNQMQLQEIFNRPRSKAADRGKLDTLEKQFKELLTSFGKIKPNFELGEEKKKESLYEYFDGIVEDESLAFHDISQLNEKKLQERHEDVNRLQKDFITVNDLFKDSAKLIGEQGDMLVASENNLMIAVEQSGKGVEDLVKADVYQQKAKKKLWCICAIATIVVAVLLAIVLGVVYK